MELFQVEGNMNVGIKKYVCIRGGEERVGDPLAH